MMDGTDAGLITTALDSGRKIQTCSRTHRCAHAKGAGAALCGCGTSDQRELMQDRRGVVEHAAGSRQKKCRALGERQREFFYVGCSGLASLFFRFFDGSCGFLEFAVSSVCPLSARYFLNPAKGGSLPPPDSQVEQNSRCRRWPLLHRNPPGSIPFAVRFPPFGGTKKMCGPFARSTQKRRQTFASEIPCPVTKSLFSPGQFEGGSLSS
ncbi:hypothetical protein Dret_1479 [Desulfohalobium retbaense DSM 5692]|uniref:Uncharacterized protein n=1 Tax=Desulfohalobium retbaense (strain ATCC 49708 / DSM 5692 / JCM 16813 / HR100) TaxID=485915 RepID=C8X2W9_DESRD|nr:hypothetical protein Dret_1479 [Desulfohalobium retbaense DSM 5692]